MAFILGVGAFGNDVCLLQTYLNRELSASLVVDGSFGGNTKAEVLRFRTRFGLPASPTFDDQCFEISARRGFAPPDFDTTASHQGLEWPKKRTGLTSPPGSTMQAQCGQIAFVHTPVAGNPEKIRVTNNFEADNIATVDIPQLRGCVVPLDSGVTKTDGEIRFHSNHTGRLQKLFREWEEAALLDRILTFDGSFNLRLKRGSTTASVANLSNHSWGTAFDINAHWNQRSTIPAMMAARGCVREMVAIAHDNGFFWGGHFSTKDGMHFEVATESL